MKNNKKIVTRTHNKAKPEGQQPYTKHPHANNHILKKIPLNTHKLA